MSKKKILCLFDVDGTLTRSRQVIDPDMNRFLTEVLKPTCALGLVGGSDFNKISEQMNGDDVIKRFDFVFAENGLVHYKYGSEGPRQSIDKHIKEDDLQRFINFCLQYLSKLNLPKKRGTFIEFRSGMINVSPIGRSCSQEDRDAFERYDKIHNVRQSMIDALKKEFTNIDLTYSIGGQISFDVFPHGWDKTYCLTHLESEGFDEIHFFGDKTDLGGNDYEIFNDSRVIGHKVKNPDDTRKILKELFKL
ncbi:phosphomannomutase [Holotrichia oblita]|uniref:Phosphomannomutase n=1 Tax=Holotrichia oblita TaxID=644536 RepID=A0ACB9SRV5_HOLOL|nr:phosphomannomutase [Holotrichia oblita]